MTVLSKNGNSDVDREYQEAGAIAETEMVVELWSDAGVCEQTLVMDANQRPWVTQLLADSDYAIALQPGIINNQTIENLVEMALFTPRAAVVGQVNDALQQPEATHQKLVDVHATILGLPKGVTPLRYRFSNAHHQYSFSLDSDSRQQTLPMRMAPGLYSIDVDDVFAEGTRWCCQKAMPLRLLQRANQIVLEFIPGACECEPLTE
ncbi:MAG: hypothetical protein ACRCYL_14955 [Kluyvera sp.]